MTALDRHFPPAGPCGLCGGPDKRHRLWDAIRERREAGESVASIMSDYGLTRAAVLVVLRRVS